jgi:hypothetical protein
LNAAPDGSAGIQGFGGGGGFANAGGGGAGMGGAIFNMQGEVTIRASTLTDNTAIGGIDNVPDNQIDPAAGLGGAVFNLSGSVEVVGSTLAGNVASKSGSSIYNTVLDAVTERTGLTTLRDTIVADAGAPTDLVSAKFAGVPSGELNLGSANAAVGDLNLVLSMTAEELGTIAGTALTVDPKLGALSNNGGGTQTLAPAPDSPVVDAGSAFGLGADQRGLPRPSDFAPIANAGDGSDIGAFELQVPQGPAPPGAQPNLVGSRVSARFRLRGRSTIVRRLRVARLPARARVAVACARKRGNCPFKRRTRRYPAGKALDRFEGLFKSRRLLPRTVITVRVTAPGLIGLFVRYTTRAGKRPRRQQLCLQPGQRRPTRC